MSQNPIYQLSYQVCPIILTGGIAKDIPGSMLPMLKLLDPSTMGGPNAATLAGTPGSLPILTPINQNNLDNAFGAFNVLPGGTLVSQQIAKYPFANQDVAANAVIREPLTLSLIMDAPMRWANAWRMKLMVFTTLKATLNAHNNLGGTYTVCTPAFQYDNLIMLALTDNSRGNNSLPQNAWRFDFEKPMVALSDLEASYNLQLSKLNNQVQFNLFKGPQTGQPQADPVKNEGATPVLDAGTTMQNTFMAAGMLTGSPQNNTLLAANFPAIAPIASSALTGIS